LSLSTKNNKDVFLNEEKLDKETTLENLFDSKIIPWLKKEYYVLLKVIWNLDLKAKKSELNCVNDVIEKYLT
jgi:hypothetical protein